MKKYELLLVLPGTHDENEATAKSKEVLALVKEHCGDAELHELGKNRLAYPIKQIRYGYFYTIVFSADPAQLKVVQDKLVLRRELLRAMISHYNTSASSLQKMAYATEETGAPAVAEKEAVVEAVMPTAEAVEELPVAKKADKKADKKAEKLDIDAINKKLDDIMSGDIVPQV